MVYASGITYRCSLLYSKNKRRDKNTCILDKDKVKITDTEMW